MKVGSEIVGARRRVSRLLGIFSIQSKLIIMLVLSSLMATVIIAGIAFYTGRTNLRNAAFDRLTEIRETQSRALKNQITDLSSALISYTHGSLVPLALRDFSTGFDQLSDAPVSPADQQRIADYYKQVFLPQTEKNSGEKLDVKALLPISNPQSYLQAAYTSRRQTDDVAITINDAGDGSAWSAANARYQDFFREIVTRFEFQDALLIDARGNVVYSVYKDVDLGTNIVDGPFRASKLHDAFTEAMTANVADRISFTDFEFYEPAEMSPTAWMVARLPATGKPQGVLAFQLPIAKINRLMTFDKHWDQVGMGETGETVLGGPDFLMRSDSRLFLENPDEYRRAVVEAGTAPDAAEIAIRQGGTTLVQPLSPQPQSSAQQGESGTLINKDYLGRETLQAYAPLSGKDWNLHWTIAAKITTAEAFHSAVKFTRTVVIAAVGIISLVCLLAIILAQLFIRPLRRLEQGAQRIADGDLTVQFPVGARRDEIGDLTAAFNEMSRGLQTNAAVIERQQKENERLLASLMPGSIAAKLRNGEEVDAADHESVTVVLIDVDGVDALQDELGAERWLQHWNELSHQFDMAAAEFHLEPVRTFGRGYLAVCGLGVARLDSVALGTRFAWECFRIADRWNAEFGERLTVRAGVDTGALGSGMVGQAPSVVFHVWGAALAGADRAANAGTAPGVYLTSRARATLPDVAMFSPASDDESVWRLDDLA